MGAAGLKRAQSVYDWSSIIPQYQAFWADLADRRAAARGKPGTYAGLPSPRAPAPSDSFRSFPTRSGFDEAERFARTPGAATPMSGCSTPSPGPEGSPTCTPGSTCRRKRWSAACSGCSNTI